MELGRYLVDAVVLQGRSYRDVAGAHGVSKSWVQKLVARYRTGGYDAISPRSKAPKRVANRSSAELEDRIVRIRKELTEQGFDSGAQTIHYHLSLTDPAPPSTSTIWRVLKRRGFVAPQPHKRPKSSYIRFEADLPNETWQADVTFWELADGSKVEILNFLDDFSRVCVASNVLAVTNSPDVVATLYEAGAAWGLPASLLTDNGCIFTAAYRYGYSALESELFHLGIAYKHSRPYHPQTCGKVERFHQTLKKFLKKAAPCAHDRRAPGPGRSLRRLLQRHPSAPRQGTHDAARRVRLEGQGPTSCGQPQPQQGAARAARQGRQGRLGHPPLQKQAPSHRHGQGAQGDARDPARCGTRHPGAVFRW